MKQFLLMMIGFEGSGRTAYANSTGLPVVYNQSDALRALTQGKSVVFDAPNLRSRSRKAFIDQVTALGCEARAVLMATPLEQCLCAMPQVRSLIREQYLSFYPPYDYEGWADIKVVHPETCDFVSLVDLFFGKQGLVFIPQNNPFHAHSIGMHCLIAAKNVALSKPDDIALWLAALLHDIGKAKTKAFLDNHGRPTATAHYYNHEFASAYESLFVRLPDQVTQRQRLRVSALIVWHMLPHFFTNERTKNRYLRLWGQAFFDDVRLLEAADKSAQKMQ